MNECRKDPLVGSLIPTITLPSNDTPLARLNTPPRTPSPTAGPVPVQMVACRNDEVPHQPTSTLPLGEIAWAPPMVAPASRPSVWAGPLPVQSTGRSPALEPL